MAEAEFGGEGAAHGVVGFVGGGVGAHEAGHVGVEDAVALEGGADVAVEGGEGAVAVAFADLGGHVAIGNDDGIAVGEVDGAGQERLGQGGVGGEIREADVGADDVQFIEAIGERLGFAHVVGIDAADDFGEHGVAGVAVVVAFVGGEIGELVERGLRDHFLHGEGVLGVLLRFPRGIGIAAASGDDVVIHVVGARRVAQELFDGDEVLVGNGPIRAFGDEGLVGAGDHVHDAVGDVEQAHLLQEEDGGGGEVLGVAGEAEGGVGGEGLFGGGGGRGEKPVVGGLENEAKGGHGIVESHFEFAAYFVDGVGNALGRRDGADEAGEVGGGGDGGLGEGFEVGEVEGADGVVGRVVVGGDVAVFPVFDGEDGRDADVPERLVVAVAFAVGIDEGDEAVG